MATLPPQTDTTLRTTSDPIVTWLKAISLIMGMIYPVFLGSHTSLRAEFPFTVLIGTIIMGDLAVTGASI